VSHSHQFVALFGLFFSSCVHAVEFFADALYWHTTEAIDWVYANDQHLPNQTITYKTLSFDFEPGFRLGINSQGNCKAALYYTRFHTHSSDAVFGNVISGFISDRIANFPNGHFFQAGQINIAIDYNMFDVDLSKSFYFGERVIFAPMLGIRGGWINQKIQSTFQGSVSAVENVKNDFIGLGPKAGVDTQLSLFCANNTDFGLFADFSVSYLWGHWKIRDVYVDTTPATVRVIVPSRHIGALATQAILGLHFNHKDLSIKLGYEIMDWFEQCQFFDNGTGAHSNNLVLQGYTFRLSYSL